MFTALPLMIIPVAVYVVLAIVTGASIFTATAWQGALPSNGVLTLSAGDCVAALGLLFLFVEVVKSTRASTTSIIDHALSTFLLIACILAFVLVRACATPSFAFLTLMCLIDVIAGFSVSIRTARRDIAVDHVQ